MVSYYVMTQGCLIPLLDPGSRETIYMTETATAIDWFGPDTATFGDRLAGARDEAGLSQEALAAKLGIKLSTLKDWEDDLSEPRANKLQMLSGVLNVSIPWLLTGEGAGPDAPGTAAQDPVDRAAILADIAKIRSELGATLEHLAMLELKLRNKT